MKKMSEMTCAELSKVLCEIAPAVGNLAQDDEVVEALKKVQENKQNNVIVARLFGCAYSQIIPLLFEKHRKDTFTVLGVLTGKSIEELEAENAFQLIRDIRGLLSSELICFFG